MGVPNDISKTYSKLMLMKILILTFEAYFPMISDIVFFNN